MCRAAKSMRSGRRSVLRDCRFFRRSGALSFQRSKNTVKSLISSFHYPERGPGQMWETLAELLEQNGQSVVLGQRVVRVATKAGRSHE